jgi:hypothetical protein
MKAPVSYIGEPENAIRDSSSKSDEAWRGDNRHYSAALIAHDFSHRFLARIGRGQAPPDSNSVAMACQS